MGSLRRALAQNPQMISEILQEMGQSNPELVQQLVANPQALQQIFRSAAGEGGEDEGEEEDDFGGMEEQMGQQVVQLTPAEDATVRRITELGFPYERALEVSIGLIACPSYLFKRLCRHFCFVIATKNLQSTTF
jgi:UV excision repair protein RAD23